MMKKLVKIITVVLVIALCLLTPGMPVAVNGALKLTPASSSPYQYSAPSQSSLTFSTEEVGNYDLSNWNKPSNDYLVAQQVTPETNASFHEKYEYTTLTDGELNGRSPYVIACTTQNMPVNGGYTTDVITLPANGYYMVEVEYRLNEQTNNTTEQYAFGTFYLDDEHYITLQGNGWLRKAFYIHTDLLESTTVNPALYFGSKTQKALGAIYFNQFNVVALSASKFAAATANIDSTCYLDLSRQNIEYVSVRNFNNNEFTTSAESINAITASSIPAYLGFNDEQAYFYTKDGSDNDSVMIMRANNGNATLTLSNYDFTPKPHEVYMFQFYSIATAAEDFDSFYFMITDNDSDKGSAEQITTLANYPYYNGWQLNTVFFVAGQDLYQDYTLSFNLSSSSSSTATGWVCIDDFRIYKVNGSYATDNKSATGVHDTYDMNAEADALDLPNGYFELGTAADTVTVSGSGYPYPLIANDWTTNNSDNGIVNLDASLWNESFGEGTNHPGYIVNYNSNNNVYMMHNRNSTRNILTSPAISTTAGETKTVSFHACSKTTTKTHAWIISATADDDGNLTDITYLGEPLKIETDGAWQHYTINIAENEFAVSRSYYLRFEMDAIGYTYIDNVCFDDSKQNDEINNIDLTNPLTLSGIWHTNNDTVDFYLNSTKDGLTLKNIGGQKTIIENVFAYNLSSENYYEIIVTARGNHAYLGFDGYDGLMKVTTDEIDETLTAEYKLLIHADDVNTTKFQITLGYVADENDDESTVKVVDGEIFISAITVNKIEETEFDDAKTAANTDGSRVMVLSASEETEEEENTNNSNADGSNFFNENWWYLVPTLITAAAVLLAVATFLFRKIKFEKHITKKNTSYARDMRIKKERNKIVAQKAAKVDNITDDKTQSN
ncbi:MAG: hypothetical protein J5598_00495 [Clostridia bacterium]|nr:hypothetical protein [Clostridia bacterium]